MIFFIECSDEKIFTTGAFLQPVQIKDKNDNNLWVWAVERFVDSSFCDGQEFNPVVIAKSLEELLINTTVDE